MGKLLLRQFLIRSNHMNNVSMSSAEIEDIKELQKTLADLALKVAQYYEVELNFSTESI